MARSANKGKQSKRRLAKPAKPPSKFPLRTRNKKPVVKNALTETEFIVFSEKTETKENEGTHTSSAKVHSPLGRDGHALGHQPHGGPSACAPFHLPQTTQCG